MKILMLGLVFPLLICCAQPEEQDLQHGDSMDEVRAIYGIETTVISLVSSSPDPEATSSHYYQDLNRIYLFDSGHQLCKIVEDAVEAEAHSCN